MSQAEQDQRIDYIEFTSTDLERCKVFYSGCFGWTFQNWGPEYVSFEDGRLAGGFASAEEVVPGGPLIVLYAIDLPGTEARVKEQGGAIVKETFAFPGGHRFHFADPDGNVLAVWSDQMLTEG